MTTTNSKGLGRIARRALVTQPDSRLVELVRAGHDGAFEEMVRRYRSPLVAFATAMVGSSAEDVVQVSLAKAHAALAGATGEINLRPWLFTIVRNGALNLIRDTPRHEELEYHLGGDGVGGGDPAVIAEQNEQMRGLVAAICALPEKQRQALVRRELDGIGHGEIAAQLGTSATAVRGLIFRAREGLRAAAGAVVPLPILTGLLGGGAAGAGAVGAGSGGGLGAGGLLSGAGGLVGGVKLGAAVTATVAVVAGGVALKHDGDGPNSTGTPGREANPTTDPAAAVAQPSLNEPTTAANPAQSAGGESHHAAEGGDRGGGRRDEPTTFDGEDTGQAEGPDRGGDRSAGHDQPGYDPGDNQQSGPGEDGGGAGGEETDPGDNQHHGPGDDGNLSGDAGDGGGSNGSGGGGGDSGGGEDGSNDSGGDQADTHDDDPPAQPDGQSDGDSETEGNGNDPSVPGEHRTAPLDDPLADRRRRSR